MSLLGTRSPQTASFSVFTALTNSCGIFLLCSVPLFGKHQVGEQGSGLSGRKRLWGWESSVLWGAGNELPCCKPSPALPKTIACLTQNPHTAGQGILARLWCGQSTVVPCPGQGQECVGTTAGKLGHFLCF